MDVVNVDVFVSVMLLREVDVEVPVVNVDIVEVPVVLVTVSVVVAVVSVAVVSVVVLSQAMFLCKQHHSTFACIHVSLQFANRSLQS